jgi:hypothetical protein
MKKIFLCLLLVSYTAIIFGQRVDLDKACFTHNYKSLPSIFLDKSYNTFSIQVTKSTALKVLSVETNTNGINIEGKKKLESGGHLLINLDLGDFNIESSEVKERVDIQKDKDGKETGRKYYYRVDVVYTFTANASAKDYTGKDYRYWILSQRNEKKTYSTAEYSKSSDATNYYNNNRLEIKTRLIEEQINSAVSTLNSSLNTTFGYVTDSARECFWDLGSKKHAEFANYTAATATAIEAIQMIAAIKIPSESLEKLRPSIEYYKSLIEKYTSDDKGDKKIRYGAYYNLGLIYLVVEQFDLAKEAGENLIKNDYDKKDGEDIIKRADKVKADLEKHQLSSRHFEIDLSNAAGPQ